MTHFKPLSLLLLLLAGCAQQPASVPQPANTSDKPNAGAAQTVPSGADVAQEPLDTVMRPATGVTLQLSQTLQQQFEAGKQQLLAQDYQQAVVQFSALANAEPGFAGIWYNLALAQWRSGQIDAAQASLQQAVKVAPMHIDSHNLLGVLARQRGQLELAKQHFQQALTVDANYAMAHKNLAFLYELYLGAPEQAYQHYQTYYQLTQDEQVKIWLALLQQELQLEPGAEESSNE
ncbi:tetratricopeptide repeat protein [Rheinheimera sp.]